MYFSPLVFLHPMRLVGEHCQYKSVDWKYGKVGYLISLNEAVWCVLTCCVMEKWEPMTGNEAETYVTDLFVGVFQNKLQTTITYV